MMPKSSKWSQVTANVAWLSVISLISESKVNVINRNDNANLSSVYGMLVDKRKLHFFLCDRKMENYCYYF